MTGKPEPVAKITGYCCTQMLASSMLRCTRHPDVLVWYSEQHGPGLPIRDGGGSFQEIRFCPWCGTNLANSGAPPWDISRLCSDTTGPAGVGGECVLPPGHPHVDGIGNRWTAIPAGLDPDALARALHDADCGCGDYDDIEDPRYIQAVHAALRGTS